MSIESKTTHTGPLPATLAPMTVDMVGPKGVFGKLDLPEVKTNSKGALVNVTDQPIKIIDMEAYKAFTKSIQLDEKLTMQLDNGKGTIKALGMKSKITYKKPVTMFGMDGPQTQVIKTEILGDGRFKNTMKIINPSPVEIDMGNVTMAYKNAAGEVLATQKANIFITRGETIYQATGEVKAKGNVDRVSLVGLEPEKESWIKYTLSWFNVPVTLTPEMIQLLKA
jgi:uncharacterized protein DUF3712